jgi:uncharacterized membrane protein
MKKILLIVSLFSIAFVACHKHDDAITPYSIAFDVKNDAGSATLDGTMGKEMTFDVTFTHNGKSTIHNVKVSILDAADKEIKVLEDKHAHVTATYNTKLKYTPSTVGSFKLKVSSTNDNGGESNEKTLPFVIK